MNQPLSQDLDFYESVKPFMDFHEVMDLKHYQKVPDSWFAVIADIKGSTKALEQGLYKEINIIGASCIMSVLNALKGQKDVPFVFGGDGASFVIPPTAIEPVCSALLGAINMAHDTFGLHLRAGYVPVSVLSQEQKEILVAKYKLSKNINIAMFKGGGLSAAEDIVKSKDEKRMYPIDEIFFPQIKTIADFHGLECRWNPIPSHKDVTLTIMVSSRAGDDVYQNVIKNINKIFGTEDSYKPVAPEKLSLSFKPKNLRQEFGVQTHKGSFLEKITYSLKMFTENALASFLFLTKGSLGEFDGSKYKEDSIRTSDYQKFDDCLRLVINANKDEARAFEKFLEQEYQNDKLYYGLNYSDNALMTCLVFNRDEDHVHFIDGDAGGYTLAAKNMKAQLAAADK